MAEPPVPFADRSDADLERALRELGTRLGYPATPDIAAAIRGRLAAPPASRWLPGWTGPRLVPPRLLTAAAVVVVLMSVLLLALLPGVRSAVADRLGLRGVVIRFIDDEPTVVPSPVGHRLMLGRRVSLDEAQTTVAYPIQVPSADLLGPADEVYVSARPADQMVSMVYRAGPDLPAGSLPGVGALLTQFRGETDRDLIQKGLFEKGVGAGTTLEAVTVDGELGFWIEGEAHFFMYRDPTGLFREEEFRLAGNVLLWERDGLTFRLESQLPREDAIRVAESVRAVD